MYVLYCTCTRVLANSQKCNANEIVIMYMCTCMYYTVHVHVHVYLQTVKSAMPMRLL